MAVRTLQNIWDGELCNKSKRLRVAIHCCKVFQCRCLWWVLATSLVRSSHWRYSVKKLLLEISQNSQKKHLCQSLLNKVAGLSLQLYQKETLAQVFSCEFCEISKNAFFYQTFLVAASAIHMTTQWWYHHHYMTKGARWTPLHSTPGAISDIYSSWIQIY